MSTTVELLAVDELNKQLRLLYHSIGSTMNADLTKTAPKLYHSSKGFLLFQDFRGGRNEAELENIIQLVIHNIASLFGHFRAWARGSGRGVAHVDNALRSSPDLKIIMDLWNLKKHAKHDRNGGWSKRRPTLQNIDSLLRLTSRAGHGAFYTCSPLGEQRSSGDTQVIVNADVVDDKGNKIDDFHDIAQRAVGEWQRLWARLK